QAAMWYSLKGVSSLQWGVFSVQDLTVRSGETLCGFGFPPERSWAGKEPNSISGDPVSQGREDFLTFDKETMTWVAADIGAQITKRRWDAEVDDNQGWNLYLEEECILWLRSALEYGKETLQRKVRPTARVSDRSSHDGLTTLSCKVSGFYPRDITVTWLKNGESRQQETYSEGILPSGDGTYQTWVTMEIDPKIKAHYSCRMEHESLLEPLSVFWGKAQVLVLELGSTVPGAHVLLSSLLPLRLLDTSQQYSASEGRRLTMRH
uniref:Ig-like domain-containing protein n=1 Tax=Terrapene triunguis TaxID=2587831 RepID=A0A674JB07_9SAUR